MNIGELVAAQKAFFRSGATLDSRFRRAQLEKLLSAVCRFEPELCAALAADLLSHISAPAGGQPGNQDSHYAMGEKRKDA